MLEFLQPLQKIKIKGDRGTDRKSTQQWDKEGSRESTRLVLGSSLQAAFFHSAVFADVLLQSSCPINSIQPGRKRLSSNTQLESKHNPTGEYQITDTVEMTDMSNLMI